MWGINWNREGSPPDSDWSGIGQRSDSELQANNPVKYTDPDGKVAAIDDATIAAAIVITTGVIAMANNQSYKDSADKDKNNSTGAYTINFELGMKYHGTGGQKRAI